MRGVLPPRLESQPIPRTQHLSGWALRAEGSTTTLASVVDWLGAVFIELSIPLTTSAWILTGFENADLVTVVAHGQIVPERSYFQTIADDAALKVAAASLAIALRNVGVVILFVCSGGRVDRHPAADTTFGLAKAPRMMSARLGGRIYAGAEITCGGLRASPALFWSIQAVLWRPTP